MNKVDKSKYQSYSHLINHTPDDIKSAWEEVNTDLLDSKVGPDMTLEEIDEAYNKAVDLVIKWENKPLAKTPGFLILMVYLLGITVIEVALLGFGNFSWGINILSVCLYASLFFTGVMVSFNLANEKANELYKKAFQNLGAPLSSFKHFMTMFLSKFNLLVEDLSHENIVKSLMESATEIMKKEQRMMLLTVQYQKDQNLVGMVDAITSLEEARLAFNQKFDLLQSLGEDFCKNYPTKALIFSKAAQAQFLENLKKTYDRQHVRRY